MRQGQGLRQGRWQWQGHGQRPGKRGNEPFVLSGISGVSGIPAIAELSGCSRIPEISGIFTLSTISKICIIWIISVGWGLWTPPHPLPPLPQKSLRLLRSPRSPGILSVTSQTSHVFWGTLSTAWGILVGTCSSYLLSITPYCLRHYRACRNKVFLSLADGAQEVAWELPPASWTYY